MDNICEYLFIKTETAMLSPHFVLLMRTPIVMPRPASSFLNISTISVRCSMVVPTGSRQVGINWDAGRLRRSGYTESMVAHPQSPSRVPRTHQSDILPRPHYGVHKVRLTFAHPSLDLRSSFAHPSLILRSRRQPPLDGFLAWFLVGDDIINKNEYA